MLGKYHGDHKESSCSPQYYYMIEPRTDRNLSILKFQSGLLPNSAIDTCYIAFRAHMLSYSGKMVVSDLNVFHLRTRCLCKIQHMLCIFPCKVNGEKWLQRNQQSF